jgi:hypothetical protein
MLISLVTPTQVFGQSVYSKMVVGKAANKQSNFDRIFELSGAEVVGDTGLEPVTSTV